MTMTHSETVRENITNQISSNRVVLFMKGTRQAPRCGFSAQVCAVLGDLGIDFKTIDVLSNPEIRDEIKSFSNWPTIPQLYVDGQFVGGCDIVTELNRTGELNQMLGVTKVQRPPPTIRITDSAAAAFKKADEGGAERLRLEIGPSYEHDLCFDLPKSDDIEVSDNGVTLRLSASSASKAEGLRIDYTDGPKGAGFKIENPGEPARVKDLSAQELKQLLDTGTSPDIFDVRTDQERRIACIPNTRAFDADGEAYLRSLDKNKTIILHCHHGMRSRAVAEQLVAAGFKNVYNLEGGIDAWSTSIDASVPRY